MAHIGADCIACIALRCVALHLQLQMQFGMTGIPFVVDIGLVLLVLGKRFAFLDSVMIFAWYVGM